MVKEYMVHFSDVVAACIDNRVLDISHDFHLWFRSPSALRGHFLQAAIIWGHAGCPLSGVERCPLLGGSKCTRKSYRRHRICQLYRGGPLFGESAIRGFTIEELEKVCWTAAEDH